MNAGSKYGAVAPELSSSSRFVAHARVGEGAVGVVYDAFDRERRARVAIKTLRDPTPETILLLKKEFRALEDLRHPNLCSLGELFEENGTWFFTMEYVAGTTFLRYVRPGSGGSAPSIAPPPDSRIVPAATGAVDEKRLRSALAQLARGVATLHAAKKVHRDLKPSNVLVTPEGRLVILDFGLLSDLVAMQRRPTDQGMQGTIPYMAPEQAMGEEVGFAADWYAVGVMLYQALVGRLPFLGAPHEIVEAKVTREPEPPQSVSPGVPLDLAELCVDLLRLEPSARPTGAQILERLGIDDAVDSRGSFSHVFVGRGSELAVLRDAYATAAGGKAVTVFVHGESGVGKSYLVRQFTDELSREDARTLLLAGRCYERESVAYKAVDGVIDELGQRLGEMHDDELGAIVPPGIGAVAQVFPALAPIAKHDRGSLAQIGTISPEQMRRHVFATLRRLLDGLARSRPVVVVIDDLQWADADSLALLADVMRPPDAPPLLLVVTMRIATESNHPRPRHPSAGHLRPMSAIPGDVRHLHLDQLGHDDAALLVRQLLEASGTHEAADVDAIVNDTKGHPLFIDELVRQRAANVHESGTLRLDDALHARVARLGATARRVLEAVATAGVPIPQHAAAKAAAIDVGDLFEIVSVLRAEHFVRTSGVGQKDSIEPYHDRIRESVVTRLEAGARREWHGRLAVALEAAEGVDPESLAVHWEGAGRSDRAAEYAIVAAERASEALAFDRAARLYERAMELDPRGAGALRAKLAEALTNAGRGAEAADVRLALASESDPTTALDLRRLAAEQLMCSGHFDRGVSILRDALREVHVRDPRSAIGVIVGLLFFRLLLRLRGLAFTERAPEDVRRQTLVRCDAVRSAGAGLSMTDNIRGAYFQTRNLLMVLRAGDPSRVARALCMEVCFTAAGGPAAEARAAQLLVQAKALCAKLGTNEASAMAHTAEGYTRYFVGDWAGARAPLERAEETFRESIGMTFELNTSRTILYRSLTYLGDARALAARVPAVLREAEEHDDVYTRINLCAGPLAFLGLVQGDAAGVRHDVDEVAESLPKSRFLVQTYFCMVARTQADLYDGRARRAHREIESQWSALERSLMLRVPVMRVAAVEQRGRCAFAAWAERPGEGTRLLDFAAAQARTLGRIPMAWARGSSSMLRAAIAAARGDADGARTAARDAAAAYDEASMAIHAALARRRLGEIEGGDEGRARIEEADRALAAQGVADPARLARVFAPFARR